MISYFVRRWRKGVKGSGTKDLIKMEEIPYDFPALVEPFGPGKYILFQREKGVRGFSKVLEHIVPEPAKAFAAETVSVNQTVDVSQIPTEQLQKLMSEMVSKPQASEAFAADLQKVYTEVMSRAETTLAAETGGGGNFLSQHLPGIVVGGLITGIPLTAAVHKRGKEIEELRELIEKQAETVSELTTAVKRAEHERKKTAAAEDAAQKAKRKAMGMDSDFLSEYNRANGWR